MTLARYAPLRSGPWKRKAVAAAAPDWKKREAEERERRDKERKAERKALIFGAEYGQIFLREWFKINGCPLCSSGRAAKCHLHHVVAGSSRRAEHQVPLCPDCHVWGGGSVHNAGAHTAEDRGSGVNLREVAASLAAEGGAQGYLPVERCTGCAFWHSTRFFVDVIDEATGELTARLCQECAPGGPP